MKKYVPMRTRFWFPFSTLKTNAGNPLFLLLHTNCVVTALSSTYITCTPSDTCHNTPGNEPDEYQPDQLLLSVTYFCQEHSKPLWQYRDTVIVVSYALDIFIGEVSWDPPKLGIVIQFYEDKIPDSWWQPCWNVWIRGW